MKEELKEEDTEEGEMKPTIDKNNTPRNERHISDKEGKETRSVRREVTADP